jgi:hypothetical protein
VVRFSNLSSLLALAEPPQLMSVVLRSDHGDQKDAGKGSCVPRVPERTDFNESQNIQ